VYTIVEEDNYIDKPKFDGYRSYHAIIRDKNGVESELQIRTKRQDKFAIWAHDLYKPPTDDLKNFVDTHQDLVIDYSVQMSDYLAALDEGRNTKKPDCPKPIEEVEMCL
jgi:ppGpp synthetase/RelA/SpoT-type nucleotidyltranferase